MFEFQEPELHLLAAFAQRQTQFPLITDRLDLIIFHVKVELVKHVIVGHMPVQSEIIAPQTESVQGVVELQTGHEGAILAATADIRVVAGIMDRIQERPVDLVSTQPVATFDAAVKDPLRCLHTLRSWLIDIACWLLAARQLHRQSGMLDAQGDPFSAQFLEALVVPDLAANVADPFATNILSPTFHIKRIA